MEENLYCKLYINSELSVDVLYNLCNEFLHGKSEGIRTLSTEYLEFDLRKNSEYDEKKRGQFLFWRYYADIETKTDKRDVYVDSIRKLKYFLNNRNICTIAACDFESELEI